MVFLRFLSRFVQNQGGLRDQYKGAISDQARVALLKAQGLGKRQIGIVLREDRVAAAAEVSREVQGWDFAGNREGAPDDNAWAPPGGEDERDDDDDDLVAWPGPDMAVVVEDVQPAQVMTGVETQVVVHGWHLAEASELRFQSAGAQVIAATDWVHTDIVSGETWVGCRVTLPVAGGYDLTVTNLVGNLSGYASMLPGALTAE